MFVNNKQTPLTINLRNQISIAVKLLGQNIINQVNHKLHPSDTAPPSPQLFSFHFLKSKNQQRKKEIKPPKRENPCNY